MNLKMTSMSMALRAIGKKLFCVSTIYFGVVFYVAGYLGWDTGITSKWALVAWSMVLGIEAAVVIPIFEKWFMGWAEDFTFGRAEAQREGPVIYGGDESGASHSLYPKTHMTVGCIGNTATNGKL